MCGKTHHRIKSLYTGNRCGIKTPNTTPTNSLSQECGVRQGCCLSPTLFNICVNELSTTLEQSTEPALTPHHSEIIFLIYVDHLVLLSPTEQGLQQNLHLLERYCQTWAWTVNLKKTNIMIFQKGSGSQGTEPTFRLGTKEIRHSSNSNYLGIRISSSGNFHQAVGELRDKAHRASTP